MYLLANHPSQVISVPNAEPFLPNLGRFPRKLILHMWEWFGARLSFQNQFIQPSLNLLFFSFFTLFRAVRHLSISRVREALGDSEQQKEAQRNGWSGRAVCEWASASVQPRPHRGTDRTRRVQDVSFPLYFPRGERATNYPCIWSSHERSPL